MENINEITKLATERLEEAQILYDNKKFAGAFYLAGYSVELTLKAKLCERFGIPNLFRETEANKDASSDTDFKGISDLKKLLKTHNLVLLLVCCGLRKKFDIEKRANKELSMANSLLFYSWDEKTRYKPAGHKNPKDVLIY